MTVESVQLVCLILSVFWVLLVACEVARHLILRQAVRDAWYVLTDTLRDRHDMLDSVQRILRRNGLEFSFGMRGIKDVQREARDALHRVDFDRMVAAENSLDARLTALRAQLSDFGASASAETADTLSELDICVSMANTAVDQAACRYNEVVAQCNADSHRFCVALFDLPSAQAFELRNLDRHSQGNFALEA